MHKMFHSKDGQIAAHILQVLRTAGYEAYAVGGCVRNYLLNLPIVDFDITTSAKPETVISLFPKTLQTGVRYGTVTVIQNGVFVEVTTFRSEKNYEDTRHPSQITFETSVTADLLRRDFTMNAIACSLDGTFVDPFLGQADIRARIIRCVGDPIKRMQEDLLRCVRAFRFATQLGFTIEATTLAAISQCSTQLTQIARERVATEWSKMLKGKCGLPIKQMAESGWLKVLDLSYTEKDLPGWQKFLTVYKDLPNEATQLVALSYLLRKTEFELITWLQSLRYGKDMIQTSKKRFLATHRIQTEISRKYTSEDQTFIKIQQLLFEFGLEVVEDAVILFTFFSMVCSSISIPFTTQFIQQAFAKMPIKQQTDIAITGRDVLNKINRPAGPWVGQILKKAAELVLNGELQNERQQLLTWVQKELAARD